MKNLQSATNNFPELLGLNAPRVWDTELAFVHLKTLGEADTKRTAERRLNALGLIPKELSPETLRDEHKFSPNRLLLNWAIKNARKRRKRVLFLQMHPLPDGQLCLHANDARSAHFWIPVGSLNIEELQKALIALQSHIGKPIAVFPHGQLVAYLSLIHI
jgi:sulfate adenylyltransferase subunit 2